MSDRSAATETVVVLSLVALAELVVSSIVLGITLRIKIWKKSSNLFFINMLILRVIDGSVVVPLYIARSQLKLQGYENQLICIASRFSFYLVFRMAPINMCMLALSRAFSVRSPFYYNQIATGRKILIVISTQWLLILCLQVVPLFYMSSNNTGECVYGLGKHITLIINILLVPIPLLITIVSYIIIFMNLLPPSVKRVGPPTLNLHQTRTLRSSFMFLLIVLSFILCYWPFTIYQFTQLVCPTCVTDAFDKSITGRRVVLALRAFCHSDGVLSSVLYSWMHLVVITFFKSKCRFLKNKFKSFRCFITSFISFSPSFADSAQPSANAVTHHQEGRESKIRADL